MFLLMLDVVCCNVWVGEGGRKGGGKGGDERGAVRERGKGEEGRRRRKEGGEREVYYFSMAAVWSFYLI